MVGRRRGSPRSGAAGVIGAIVLMGCVACSGSSHPSGAAASSSTRSSPTSTTTATSASSPPTSSLAPGLHPESATFVSPSDGWVLAVRPCGSVACAVVLRTHDGGRSWQTLSTPDFLTDPNSGTPFASSIRFADLTTGWAFGPLLWVTHDGGQSWRRDTAFGERSDQALNQVVALEAAAGSVYAVVHLGEGNGTTQLYRSPVGADAWSAVSGVGGAGAGLTGESLAVGRTSGALLVSLGGYWRAYRLAAGRWQPSAFPCAPIATAYAAAALAEPSLVAIECSGAGAAGQTDKETFLSRDGGATFHELDHRHSPGDAVLLAMNSSRLILATWSADSEIYTERLSGGEPSQVLSAGDGGAGFRQLGLTTTTQGFAIEGAIASGIAMYMTRDGGDTWAKVSI